MEGGLSTDLAKGAGPQEVRLEDNSKSSMGADEPQAGDTQALEGNAFRVLAKGAGPPTVRMGDSPKSTRGGAKEHASEVQGGALGRTTTRELARGMIIDIMELATVKTDRFKISKFIVRSTGGGPDPADGESQLLGDHARTPHLQQKRNRSGRAKYKWVEVSTGTMGAKGEWRRTTEPATQRCTGTANMVEDSEMRDQWMDTHSQAEKNVTGTGRDNGPLVEETVTCPPVMDDRETRDQWMDTHSKVEMNVTGTGRDNGPLVEDMELGDQWMEEMTVMETNEDELMMTTSDVGTGGNEGQGPNPKLDRAETDKMDSWRMIMGSGPVEERRRKYRKAVKRPKSSAGRGGG